MKLSGAEIVIETLIEQNVKTIFGYPGGTVIDIYDQLYKKSDRITHVLSAHEQGAAHAADGYARATGEIGVVLATSGPGATNLVTGIATAHLDSVPLLAITGNVANNMIGRDCFQEIDIAGVTLPITKHNFIVHDVNELADTIREAIRIAKSGRPGPVLVDIPKDIQQAKCEFAYKAPVVKTAGEPAPEDKVIEAANMIADSSRPYIYFGGGAVRAGAGALISELADKIDAVIGCSMMGLSELPTKLDRFLGMQGMHGHFASSKAMAKADLIIAIGARFSDRSTGDAKKFCAGARKIHIDIDDAEIGKNVKVDLGVSCDISDFLRKLIEHVDYKRNPNWMTKIEKLLEQEKEFGYGDDFLPELAVKAVSDIVDDDTEIVTDVGQHQMWTAQYYEFKKKRTWISSGGLGTMGFGMGAAIGASFGTDKRSVLITGDGSFGMDMIELATAITYHVPVTVVVVNNGALGMVRQMQNLFYNKTYSNTTLDRKTDFIRLAEAFGCEGYRASDIGQFREAFAKAYKAEGPALVELIIDKDDMVLPMLRPGGAYDRLILDKEDRI